MTQDFTKCFLCDGHVAITKEFCSTHEMFYMKCERCGVSGGRARAQGKAWHLWQLTARDEGAGSSSFEILSIYAAKDHQPYVQLLWGDNKCQFTPEQAVEHARDLIEAAEAARSDAFLMQFAREKIGLDEAAAAQIMVEFRDFRNSPEKKKEDSDG